MKTTTTISIAVRTTRPANMANNCQDIEFEEPCSILSGVETIAGVVAGVAVRHGSGQVGVAGAGVTLLSGSVSESGGASAIMPGEGDNVGVGEVTGDGVTGGTGVGSLDEEPDEEEDDERSCAVNR